MPPISATATVRLVDNPLPALRQDSVAAPFNANIKRAGSIQSLPSDKPIAIAAGTCSQISTIEARLAFSRSASRSLQSLVMLKFPCQY